MHRTPPLAVRQSKKSASNDADTNAHLGNAVIARKAFEDNRPESIAQRQIQSGIQNSPQVQATAQLQAKANLSTTANPTVQQHKNETGMPDQLKAGIEGMSGMDMSDVRVHRGSDKPAQVQAHAYAQGNDIHLGPGQEQHLPHEAWHVVQQRQGRVQPTKQLKGKVAVNDDAGLEHEADVMGAKAMQMKSSNTAVNGGLQQGSAQQGNGPVQRMTNGNESDEQKPSKRSLMNAKEFEKECLPYMGRHETNEQACDDRAREVDVWLRTNGFSIERRGAMVLNFTIEIDKVECVWSHTAGTVLIDGVNYVIDPTIAQFGGPVRTFWGTGDQWQQEVINLCNNTGTVSNVDRKALAKALKKDEMMEQKDSFGQRQNDETVKQSPEKNEMIEEVKSRGTEAKKEIPKQTPKKKSCEIL